jgi:hypothetical protein
VGYWLQRVLVLAIASGSLSTADPGRAAPACDRVVSYILEPGPNHTQWRIFDPVRRKDVLFLDVPGGFAGLRWDTTLDAACFRSRDTLYRIGWRWRARPQVITTLPAGSEDWWFNPDSSRWQAIRMGQPVQDEFDNQRCAAELWQADARGTGWRRIRSDSLDFQNLSGDLWRWSDGTSVRREGPVTTRDDLASEAYEESLLQRSAVIDDSSFMVTSFGSDSGEWQFLPLQSSPRRGVAFQWRAPEQDWGGFSGPFYLVDLDHRTRTLIEGTDERIVRSLVAEHCGLLLVPGSQGRPRLIDTSGRKIFSPASNTYDAVWVRRPRD